MGIKIEVGQGINVQGKPCVARDYTLSKRNLMLYVQAQSIRENAEIKSEDSQYKDKKSLNRKEVYIPVNDEGQKQISEHMCPWLGNRINETCHIVYELRCDGKSQSYEERHMAEENNTQGKW